MRARRVTHRCPRAIHSRYVQMRISFGKQFSCQCREYSPANDRLVERTYSKHPRTLMIYPFPIDIDLAVRAESSADRKQIGSNITVLFGCHRSQTPAPSRNLAWVMASHHCPPVALNGHKIIKVKFFCPAEQQHPPKVLSAEIFGWSQVTSPPGGKFRREGHRSQVTPPAELNIAVQ
jgi:hypothetical protein